MMVRLIRRFSRNKLLLLLLTQLFLSLTCGLPVFIAIEKPLVDVNDSIHGADGNLVRFTTPADENLRHFVIMYRIIEQSQSSVVTDVINALDPDSTYYDGNLELPVGDEIPRNKKFAYLVEYNVATGPGIIEESATRLFIDNPTPASGGDVVEISWINKTELPSITVNNLTPSELNGINLGRNLTLNVSNGSPEFYVTSFLDDYHYLPSAVPDTSDFNPVDSDLQEMKNNLGSAIIPSNIRILFCVMSVGYDTASVTPIYSQPVYLGYLEVPFGLNPEVRD